MRDVEEFSWDHGKFPIAYPDAFPRELAAALQKWSEDGQERLAAERRVPGSPWLAEWIERGQSLAREAGRVLNRSVEYCNPVTDVTELIVPPERATQPRHNPKRSR